MRTGALLESPSSQPSYSWSVSTDATGIFISLTADEMLGLPGPFTESSNVSLKHMMQA